VLQILLKLRYHKSIMDIIKEQARVIRVMEEGARSAIKTLEKLV